MELNYRRTFLYLATIFLLFLSFQLFASILTYQSGPNNVVTLSYGVTEQGIVSSDELQSYIRAQCSKHNITWESATDLGQPLIGSLKHKLIYKMNVKTGSTSFKKFLLRLNGSTERYEDMRDVHDMKYQEFNINSVIKGEFEGFFKVGFIRNPLVRFVSAYRDKVERKGKFGQQFGGNFTTEEKFRNIIERVINQQLQDIHFQPQWGKMALCWFDYDMLGQVEHLGHFIEMMQHATGTEDTPFPLSANSANSAILTEEYFKGVGEELMGRFYKHFELDFILTGYTKLGDKMFPYVDLHNPGTMEIINE